LDEDFVGVRAGVFAKVSAGDVASITTEGVIEAIVGIIADFSCETSAKFILERFAGISAEGFAFARLALKSLKTFVSMTI